MRRRTTQRSRSVRRDKEKPQDVGVMLRTKLEIIPLIYKTPKPAHFNPAVKGQEDTEKRTLRDATIIPQMLDIYTGHEYSEEVEGATHWFCNYSYYFNNAIPEGVPQRNVTYEEAKKLIADGIVNASVFEGNVKWEFSEFSEETEQPSGELLLNNGLYTKPQMFRFAGISKYDPIMYFMTVKRVKGLTGLVCNFNQDPSTSDMDVDDNNWKITSTYFRKYEFDVIGWEKDKDVECMASSMRYYMESFENNFLDDDSLVALNPILINGV